ncbi:S8 family serine peptidase [Streptomyces poriferorum]|uniref:S8 family serine peptidase n=1 Tax=Streptomyces poriferorum TaxID=2798799 RepID=A0ABY9IZ16_9ACTN|nr:MULTISPECIES: S8 family serine peptidase [unclassified Streptomyces]MDP5310137.1 S8 family serine peptidase [Streptomyces sp. Alt4]WLQ60698.1 S8 family serine peptidase [Streptomyces sp. Alt2]
MTHVPEQRRLSLVMAAAVLAAVAGAAPAAVAAPGPGTTPSAVGVLASLDGQEREALHRMATLDLGGLHVTDKAALKSAEPVDVIVQLRTPPARTARLLAAAEGRSLSETDARTAVTEAQSAFRDVLKDMFPEKQASAEKSGKQSPAPRLHRSYTHSFDGVSLSLPGDRVAELLDHAEVASVWPDSTVKALSDPQATGSGGPEAAGAEDGVARLHAEGITGKGVKVGIIDTGIDYRHPDLKGVYKGGYDFVDDDADPMETTYEDWKASGQAETNAGSTYYTEHGTHVAGIIAGQGADAKARAAHGVAPDASVHAYRVLGPYGSGSTSNIIAAMDKAADDGMDVVNMSLGAAINDPLSPQSIAADNLVLAGVTTVIAAGNSGPNPGTVATPAASALSLTVGAHSEPLTLPAYTLTAGPATAQGRLLAQPYGDALDKLTDGSLDVIDVGTGTAAGYTGKDVTGKAALVRRGGIPLDEKVRRAQDKGAAAVLLVNDNADEGHIPFYIGENPHYVPAFSLTAADGAALMATGAEVSFASAGTFRLGDGALADFSSRGPVYGSAAIKPEVTAPGVSVLSSVPADIVDPAGGDYTYAYARLSGTSMAAPYVAGTAALMLQHDRRLSPDDIKTALMNSATALPGEVSVFEAGAGAVDPYTAVHATAAVEVPETIPHVTVDGTQTEVDAVTGALDLGVLPVGCATNLKRTLRVVNDSGRPVTYDVRTAFSRGSGASADADAAHITLTTSDRIKVGAHGKKSVAAALRVPAGAPAGYYEGTVTLTPRSANGLPALHVPFGMRVAESGFAEVDMTKSVMSTGRGSEEGAVGSGAATFNLRMAGQLRSIDIFLTDADGKDLGYVGGINTVGLTEGVLYGPATVGPWYFPSTGDKATPFDPRGRFIDDGHYKLRIVGTDAAGGTDSELRDVYVDSELPSYQDAYGAWDPAHPTVVEQPADATTFPVTGTLLDAQADDIRDAGLDIGQSDNRLYYSLYSPNAPEGSFPVASDGAVAGQVKTPIGPPVTQLKLWPTDAAGNISGIRQVHIMRKGTPYVVGDASAASARAGDRVTYTLTAHELKNWKTFTSQFRYDDRNVKLVSIEPTAELKAHGPSTIRRTDVSAGSSSYSTLSFDVADSAGLSGDSMPLVKVTYEVTGGTVTANAGLSTGSTSAVDTAGTKTNLNILFYGAVRMLNPTSTFVARPAVQALLTREGAYDNVRDHTADGIEATLTAPDGTSREVALDKAGRISVSGLTPSDKPYRFRVTAPGHFTWTEDIDLGLDGTWGVAGNTGNSAAALVAGDVNGDDVVDVRDAAAVYAARGTADRAADIDHDGTVGAKDLAWVKDNYLSQNSRADHYTDPVKRLRGKSLGDYLDLM